MKTLHGMLFTFCCLIALVYPAGIYAQCGPINNWSKEDAEFFNTPNISGVTVYNIPVVSELCGNEAIVFYLKLEGKGNSLDWPIRTWIWSYGDYFLYYALIETDEDDIGKVDYLELAALYRGCVVNLRGGVSFKDRKAFANVWGLYMKTLTNAKRLIDNKCGGTAPGVSLTADPSFLLIGTGEAAYIKILGDADTYMVDRTDDWLTLHVQPFQSDTGAFMIWGKDEGSEKVKFYTPSKGEVEVSVMVVEGAFATLKENSVLYIPYLEHQGNYFQLLLSPTSFDPYRFKAMNVAGRDAYLGCSRTAKLNSTTLDIEIPCFHLGDFSFDLNSYWNSFYAMVLSIHSFDPLEFEIYKFRKLKLFQEIELCWPQILDQIRKYGK